MKNIYKLSGLLIVFTLILAACSPAAAPALLEQEDPLTVELPTAQPTQASQDNQNSNNVMPVTGDDPDQSASAEAVAALEGVYERVYLNVNPSVVNIQVQQTLSASEMPEFDFFGQPGFPQGDQIQQGIGSGFIWDEQGHIVTNNHVVEGADRVTVRFMDGTIVMADVIGTDPNSDLAVIKVDASSDLLKPVTLADSNLVKVGQMAIAIGNPFGLEGTMTVGIISAIGRSLPVDINSGPLSPSYTIPDIIQTDAPINPGNSGGVLVDNSGKVIGVTTAIESRSGVNAGIGFAVPSDMVKNVVPALIESGKYEYTWLGISGLTLTPDLAQDMGVDPNQRGILVGDVTPDSPAAKAGIQPSGQQATINGVETVVGGDIITKIDDQEITRFEDMVSYLVRKTKVGQEIEVTVLRDNQEQNLSVTLEARPVTAPSVGALPSDPRTNPGNPLPGQPTLPPDHPQIGGVYLGITGTDLSPELAQSIGLDPSLEGVLVLTVARNSPADDADLRGSTQSQPGDIITGIDDTPVTSFAELRDLIAEKESGDQITLEVLRDSQQIFIDVTLATP